MRGDVDVSGSGQTEREAPKGLFGFRSMTPWRMVVAGLYYLLAAVVGVAVMTSRKPYATTGTDVALEVLSGVLLTVALLSPAFLLSDFGYRHRLPLFKQRKAALSALGLVLFFGLLVVISAFADTLHTVPYKEAAAKEAAQQEEAASAKRAAEERRQAEAAEEQAAEDDAKKAADARAAAEAKRLANEKEAREASASAEAERAAARQEQAGAKGQLADQKKAADSAPKSGAAIGVVAPALGGKLGITATDLREMDNPNGRGTFVYAPKTVYSGVERYVLWLVLDEYAYPLNGATKDVTPDLKWPREAEETAWEKSGLNPYSPSEALDIVFGTR